MLTVYNGTNMIVLCYDFLSLDLKRKEIVKDKDFRLTDKVEIVFEKIVTPFGCSAKADIPKKYIGKRTYIIILKD